jgi:hypothetical protein
MFDTYESTALFNIFGGINSTRHALYPLFGSTNYHVVGAYLEDID